MASRPPHHMPAPAFTTLVIVTLLMARAAAFATVIVDTFDAGEVFSPTASIQVAYGERVPGQSGAFGATRTTILDAVRSAARFTIPAASYTLSSITLPIALSSSTPAAVLRVRLAADSAGVPGRTLEVLSENQSLWPPNVIPFSTSTTLTSATHPTLAAAGSFWIVTEVTSVPSGPYTFVDYEWFENTHGAQVPLLQQLSTIFLPSDPWPSFITPAPLAFRVEGVSTTGVGPPVTDDQLLMLSNPWPNPARAGVRFTLRLGRAAAVSGQVFDVAGHRVATLLDTREFPAGDWGLDWDGNDSSGKPAAAGVYLVRVSAGANSSERKLAMIR